MRVTGPGLRTVRKSKFCGSQILGKTNASWYLFEAPPFCAFLEGGASGPSPTSSLCGKFFECGYLSRFFRGIPLLYCTTVVVLLIVGSHSNLR